MNRTLWAVISFVVIVLSASSAMADDCGDILRLATRDLIHTVDTSDQRKSYYHLVCDSRNDSLGIGWKDVDEALNLNYGSKEEYCQHEQSFDASSNYSALDSSIVVRSSVDSYVKCREFDRAGVAIQLTLPATGDPIVFAVSVSRQNAFAQSIRAVQIPSRGVICATQSAGQRRSVPIGYSVIGFDLPENNSQWTLSCERKPSNTSAGQIYPMVQLLVITSAGTFPLALPEVRSGSILWSSEVSSKISTLSQQIKHESDRISGLSLTLSKHGLTDISGNGGQKDCPNQLDVVVGFKNSPSRDDTLDMFNCAKVNLNIPGE